MSYRLIAAVLLLSLTLAGCGSSKSAGSPEPAAPQVELVQVWLDNFTPAGTVMHFAAKVTNTGKRTLTGAVVQWQPLGANRAPLTTPRTFPLPRLAAGQTLEFASSEDKQTLANVASVTDLAVSMASPGSLIDGPAVVLLPVGDVSLSPVPGAPVPYYEVKGTLQIPGEVLSRNLQRWVVLKDAQGRIVGGDGGGVLPAGTPAVLPTGSRWLLDFPLVASHAPATSATVYVYVQAP